MYFDPFSHSYPSRREDTLSKEIRPLPGGMRNTIKEFAREIGGANSLADIVKSTKFSSLPKEIQTEVTRLYTRRHLED